MTHVCDPTLVFRQVNLLILAFLISNFQDFFEPNYSHNRSVNGPKISVFVREKNKFIIWRYKY